MADHACSSGCNHATLVDSVHSDPQSQLGMLQVQIDKMSMRSNKAEKTTLDVAGICCPSEIPLIRKLIEPLPGVHEVLVNVTGKTVTVHHDPALTSPSWLVKVLNDAKLEASIHNRGEWKATHKWPSPYTIVCGLMVGLTFFQYVYSPLRWTGLGAVAVGSPPVIVRAFVSLRRCILDINVLMMIAVSGAIGLGDYLEAGSIVFLFTLADWLESRSSDKARMALASVAKLAPQHAFLADNGLKVPVAEVIVGTRITVKAGDLVPIDGCVVSGKSTIDESSLTGEPLPVEKVAGATVWAGTMNLTGYLCIETTALAEDSAVARMIRLVEEAQTQRSHLEKLVEKFAKYYTPVILILAIVTATVPLALHVHNARHWLYLALVLLVAACPCALVISTPVTTTCAIAQAARIGLVVKGGDSLEALGKLKMIAMDKTGTLTEGHFRVKEVCLLNKDVDLLELLYRIACIENKASHPMASSFVAYAKMHGIEPSGEVKDFEVLAGEGVTGVLDGSVIHIGNERLAKRLHWTESNPTVLETWRLEGWTVTWVGIDEQLQAVLCAGDHLRPEAKEALTSLKKIGIQITMLTGDCQAAADIIQKKVGDIDVHAQLLPEDKVVILKQLKKIGLTGMVGDGTNDAPALASADVGIAMGVAGSAIAMEAADISLMTNDLRQLPTAVKLGRRAFQKIIQNIILSLLTKTLIIVLAVLGYASLWAAVLADVGTCLLVIFNSMLLLEREKGKLKSHAGNKESKHHCHHHHHSHCADGESHHDHQHSHCEHKESKHNQHNQGGLEECKHDPFYDHDNTGERKHGYHQQNHCSHEENKCDDHHSHYECKESRYNHQHSNCIHKENKHVQRHGESEDCKTNIQHCHCDHKETKDDYHHHHGHRNQENDDRFYEHKESNHHHHHHHRNSNCEHRESKHDQSHGDSEDCSKHNLEDIHGDHERTNHHSHCSQEESKHNHHCYNICDHEDSDHHIHFYHKASSDSNNRYSHGNHHDYSHCDYGESISDCHQIHCAYKESKNDDDQHSHVDCKESKHDRGHHHHSPCGLEESKHDSDDDGQCSRKESKHSHHNGYCYHKYIKQEPRQSLGEHEEFEHCQHDKSKTSKFDDPKARKHDDHHYKHHYHEESQPDHYRHSHHKEGEDDENVYHSYYDHKGNKHNDHCDDKESKHNDGDGDSHCDHKESEHVYQHHRHGYREAFNHDFADDCEAGKSDDEYHSHCNQNPSHGLHEECRHDQNPSHGAHEECKRDQNPGHGAYEECKHDHGHDNHEVSLNDNCHHEHASKFDDDHHSYNDQNDSQEAIKLSHGHSHDHQRHSGKGKSWLLSSAFCLQPLKPHLRKLMDEKKGGCHNKCETEGNGVGSYVNFESINRITSNKKITGHIGRPAHNLCFHTPKRVASFTEEDMAFVTQKPRTRDRDEFLCAKYCCEDLPQSKQTTT